MRIEEAIEMLGWVIDDKGYTVGEPGYDAIKLGIEALKRIQGERGKYTGWSLKSLPGETDD